MTSHSSVRSWLVAAALWLAAAGSLSAATDPLLKARQLYNQRQYDAAIDAARLAAGRPAMAAAAHLLQARSYLERYRLAPNAVDLASARAALADLNAEQLSAADRTELLVGWGELFFLEGQPGMAIEMFNAALARRDASLTVVRDRLLDWWAQSLERLGLTASSDDRVRAYGRIIERMEAELERAPDSATVVYWLAAAARGIGDIDRAWYAARTGWVRARLTLGGGAALRADLDRLVMEAIIPERARQYASVLDAQQASTAMAAEWDEIKKTW